MYGLENAYGYGRSLAVWLIEKGYIVKDINPALVYDHWKSAPTFQKNDEYNTWCVGTVLINQLHSLSDAKPEDNHWTLSQLVNRRDIISFSVILMARQYCISGRPIRHRVTYWTGRH